MPQPLRRKTFRRRKSAATRGGGGGNGENNKKNSPNTGKMKPIVRALSPEEAAADLDAWFGAQFHANAIEKTGTDPKFSSWAFEVVLGDKRLGAISGNIYWGCCNIHNIVVDPEYRGKGMGKILMEAALSEARARGCVLAALETFDFQAKPFYERLGFKVDAERDGYSDGRRCFLMSRRLTES